MKDFNDLLEFLFQLNDFELFEDFMYGLTTQKERQEFVTRTEIINRLLKKQAQHKIANELGVGVSTVTRGSKELKNGKFKVLIIEANKQIANSWPAPV